MAVFYRQSPIIVGDANAADIGDPKIKLIEGNSSGPGYSRYFNTAKNQWYYWTGGRWAEVGEGNLDIAGIINTETGFSAGGDEGADGVVELARFGGGKVKLTFKCGIVTQIEDEPE